MLTRRALLRRGLDGAGLLAGLAVARCVTDDGPAEADAGGGVDAAVQTSPWTVVRGGKGLDGAPIELWFDEEHFVAAPAPGTVARTSWSLAGHFVVPAFIDSHVHLGFLPREEDMLDGGVAMAVDLAAPTPFLTTHASPAKGAKKRPLRILASGPMITARGGYPTQSWGRDGFGREVSGAAEATRAAQDLLERGARLLKVPLDPIGPVLTDEELSAVVAAARVASVPVFAHALGRAAVLRAARSGIDGLAHTPTERLEDADLVAWRGKAVISTLMAFGASMTAVDNLARLAAAGAQVLYGTDFGNSTRAGIDVAELAALGRAGFSRATILELGTSRPARYWGADLGTLSPGATASFVATPTNPLEDLTALSSPSWVVIGGAARVRP